MSGFGFIGQALKFTDIFNLLIPLMVVTAVISVFTVPKTAICKIFAIGTGILPFLFYAILIIRGVSVFRLMNIGAYLSLVIGLGFILSGLGIMDRIWIRFKLNIQKNTRVRLLKELGQKVWDEKLSIVGAEKLKQELSKNESEIENFNSEIKKVDSEIDKNKKTFEEFRDQKENDIKDCDNQKKPLNDELDSVQEKLQNINNDMSQNERFEKDLANFKNELERLEADQNLEPNEKEIRQKAAEENIATLQKKIEEYQVKLPNWNAEKTRLEEAIKTIKDELASLDEKIKMLNDEIRDQKKQIDERVRKLEKEKKHIITKINDIQKLNSIIFENIGNIAYNNRVDDEKLKDIYNQIDITERKIRNLESR
jgi:chromosome segregation ATPase